MIQISAQTGILVAVEGVDFRKGIDGLARVCQERLQADPFCGWLFECLQDCTRRGERKSPSADHPSLSSPQWQTI